MASLQLSSYTPSEPVELSTAQRDAIRQALPSLRVTSAPGSNDRYVLTAGSVVGSVSIAGLELIITPRIPIERVMYLLSWSLGSARWQTEPTPAGIDSIVDAIVPVFVRACERATRRGLLHGYRRDDDSLLTIRGRIRIDEQLRRHYGRTPPIEVAFDEYTDDILENRILRAAIETLACRRLRPETQVQGLRRIRAALASVTPVEFVRREVPIVAYTRLNQHYEDAVELARLILRASSPELGVRHRFDGVLFDMNEVFEGYVYGALRDQLGLDARRFPKNCRGHALNLDTGGLLQLLPDLSWWEGSTCRFIGDAKFKRTDDGRGKHPDIYQLLAYETATGLTDGMLVYAAGEADPIDHDIRFGGQTIRVRVLSIEGPIESLEREVSLLADEIREMAWRESPSAGLVSGMSRAT